MAILAKKLARLVINDGNLAGDIDKDETDEPKIHGESGDCPGSPTAAFKGDYTLVKELQEVLSYPYDEQSQDVEDKYYCLRPKAFLTRVA